MRRLLFGAGLIALLVVVLVAHCLARDKTQHRFGLQRREEPEQGPTVGVMVTVEPCVLIGVSTEEPAQHRVLGSETAPPDVSGRPQDNHISFYATSGPGVYDAHKEVTLQVGSNSDEWVVAAVASPLIGDSGNIPGDRVYVRSEYTDEQVAHADDGAGPGFVSIGTRKVVLTGSSASGHQASLKFRLKTDSSDLVGVYSGTIVFSYFITP
jgi:hypothetical protein